MTKLESATTKLIQLEAKMQKLEATREKVQAEIDREVSRGAVGNNNARAMEPCHCT